MVLHMTRNRFLNFIPTIKINFPVTSIGNYLINPKSVVRVNGKINNNLHAEASGNTVLKDGVVTVGNSPAVSTGSLISSPGAGPPDCAAHEPNRTGHIHLHPTDGEMDVRAEDNQGRGSVHIRGGTPSPTDIDQHQRDYEHRYADNGVRSIMVDSKNIYLYNSRNTQTIVIPGLQ